MSIVKNKKIISLFVYDGLPEGGAKNLYRHMVHHLSNRKKYKVTYYHESYKPKNIFHLIYIGVKNFIFWDEIAKGKIRKEDLMIIFQSSLYKSTRMLEKYPNTKIYICHEPMREYYDEGHKSVQSTKDKLVNLIRIPLKYLDFHNVHNSVNTTIIANSIYSKNIIEESYKVPVQKVIYPGINPSIFQSHSKIRDNTLISVGSINKYKRQKFYIDVISKIEKSNRPDLLLVGNGFDKKYKQEIIKLAKVKDVKVRIITNATERELINLYRKTKGFLYAPINEPFGIAVLEAMATGIPIIYYKYGGGYSEILSDKNGVEVNNLDPLIWANKLSELYAKRSKINAISLFNRNQAQKYTHEKWCEAVLKI